MFGRLKDLREAPRENERLAKELAQTKKELARANDRIARQRLRIKHLTGNGGGVRPENIVWIFGAARTGSTWLSRMMGDMPGHTVWNEPLAGALFGDFYYERAGARVGKQGKHHIMGDGYRESWLSSIRAFVLKEAASRFPRLKDGYLVVKEPNGSLGAPLLMEALPESRMILLVRDPRDAVASGADAWWQGGWQEEKQAVRSSRALERLMLAGLAKEDPDAFVRVQAERHLRKMEKSRQAYELHEGRKALVRYEDLRADPAKTLARAYSALEIPVEKESLGGAIEKHSWDNIPAEEKGPGKIFRKAKPGGWREDLTPEQARIVEDVTRPLLEEFYP